MIAGAWYVTAHAARRFAQHALRWAGDDATPLPETLRALALSTIAAESALAHKLRDLPGKDGMPPGEMWRGPKPRRLRYVLGQGAGAAPAVLTVLPRCDTRKA